MYDYHTHRNQSLHNLIRSPITDDMIDYVTWKAMTVIPCTLASPPQTISDFSVNDNPSSMSQVLTGDPLLTPPNAPSEHESLYATMPSASPPPLPGQVQLPPLREFITNLVRKSHLHTGTFLATLVYLERLRKKLHSVAKGMPCTCHRVFLSTLIVTAKYVNDTSPKNRHWARYSSVFSVAEVNLMEKQLLVLLDFHLSISMDELLENIGYFLPKEGLNAEIPCQRASLNDGIHVSHSRRHHANRCSMPANITSSNLVRRYLTDNSVDYPYECYSETVTPTLSDSPYSSNELNDDYLRNSVPNLRSLTELVASPPPSYHPHCQGNVGQYGATTLSFSSNNPYRGHHGLEHQQYGPQKTRSPNMYGPTMFSAFNQPNNVQNCRPR